jgi:hypothetical protein
VRWEEAGAVNELLKLVMESLLASSVDADEVVSHLLPWFQFSRNFRAQLENIYDAVERRKHRAVVFSGDGFGENRPHHRFEIEYLGDDGIRLGDYFNLRRLRDQLYDVLSMARNDEPVEAESFRDVGDWLIADDGAVNRSSL